MSSRPDCSDAILANSWWTSAQRKNSGWGACLRFFPDFRIRVGLGSHSFNYQTLRDERIRTGTGRNDTVIGHSKERDWGQTLWRGILGIDLRRKTEDRHWEEEEWEQTLRGGRLRKDTEGRKTEDRTDTEKDKHWGEEDWEQTLRGGRLRKYTERRKTEDTHTKMRKTERRKTEDKHMEQKDWGRHWEK